MIDKAIGRINSDSYNGVSVEKINSVSYNGIWLPTYDKAKLFEVLAR